MEGASRDRGVYNQTKVMAVLNEFSKSECDFAEIILEQGEYSSVQSAYSSIIASIKRFGYTFRVRMIRGNLYLDKK